MLQARTWNKPRTKGGERPVIWALNTLKSIIIDQWFTDLCYTSITDNEYNLEDKL